MGQNACRKTYSYLIVEVAFGILIGKEQILVVNIQEGQLNHGEKHERNDMQNVAFGNGVLGTAIIATAIIILQI